MYLFFEASYIAPFGGASPGPRQLVPILPFTAVAFASAYRRFPFTTLALAIASAVEIVTLTLTRPLSASVFGDWFHRFGIRDFSETALGLAGASRRDGIYLLLGAVVASVILTALATARPVLSWREAVTGAALLGAWVLIERRAPKLLNGDEFGRGNGAFTTLLFCAAIVFVAVIGPRIVARRKPAPARE
jgi:hypothetical protein